ADGRLHLGHPAICSEAVMHPAELRGRGSKMRRTVILPMIFVAPCCFEDLFIVGGDHPSFATGRHDLVLAERESAGITDRADFPAVVSGSMRLGAILQHFQLVLPREFQNRIQIARPAREVNSDNRASTWRKHALDGSGSQVLALPVDVGKYGNGAAHHSRTG